MPLEKRYVLGERSSIMDACQPNTQRIAHCRFVIFMSLCLSQRGLVNQIHCFVNENA
jgi:hypothetical protein